MAPKFKAGDLVLMSSPHNPNEGRFLVIQCRDQDHDIDVIWLQDEKITQLYQESIFRWTAYFDTQILSADSE